MVPTHLISMIHCVDPVRYLLIAQPTISAYQIIFDSWICYQKCQDFPGGTVDRKRPASAGDMGLIHMLQSK